MFAMFESFFNNKTVVLQHFNKQIGVMPICFGVFFTPFFSVNDQLHFFVTNAFYD